MSKDATIVINREMAAVLLRCLGYGESAISQLEGEDGTEEVIYRNISIIRRQAVKFLADEIVADAVAQRKQK